MPLVVAHLILAQARPAGHLQGRGAQPCGHCKAGARACPCCRARHGCIAEQVLGRGPFDWAAAKGCLPARWRHSSKRSPLHLGGVRVAWQAPLLPLDATLSLEEAYSNSGNKPQVHVLGNPL